MWIVRVALQRPYTFIVLAALICALGPLTDFARPSMYFPVSIFQWSASYSAMADYSAAEMGTRIIGNFERSVPLTVNDIEHIESQSLLGHRYCKDSFQPNVNLDIGISQVTASANSTINQMPPGTNPPISSAITPRLCRLSNWH